MQSLTTMGRSQDFVFPTNEKLIKEWVSALNSGAYEQAFGDFRSQDGGSFCALGVLLDIVDPNGWTFYDDVDCTDLRWEWESEDYINDVRLYEDLGINWREIIAMNDQHELTFESISMIVEENYV